jgi:hypothetical protein
VYLARPRRVELIHTDLDVSDFFFPNGAFNGRHYELHSIITDSRKEGDASPYLPSAAERPLSETHGLGRLDVIGNVWSNLPSVPVGYVKRARLETEIVGALTNDRHPVITLVGRGGIGKTSLALAALHSVAATSRYDAIIWFSARDIDLTLSGPKVVKPQVLTEKDVANEFCNLLGVSTGKDRDSSPTQVMAKNMKETSIGGPMLFVFDNFETVKSPVDLFQWIDTNIRLPNKALITSRFRDFKADYPIDISGMERAEADELITKTASELAISHLMTSKFRDELFEQSDGHPYVIKVMLGEVADKKTLSKPERVISRKEDILEALFERTFSNLSPIASRIFLTLSAWRSLVPQLALEAVLLREQTDSVDPCGGIEELIRMSLIQRTFADDSTAFLDAPLAASLFGRKKLSVSPLKVVIENDVSLLQEFGAASSASMKGGIGPRIERLFRKVAERISRDNDELSKMRPMLEFIARSYPPAWLLLSNLQEEVGGKDYIDQAAEYVRRYLENNPEETESRRAWERLAALYKRSGNVLGAVGAFVRALDVHTAPLDEISDMANWLNRKHDEIASMDSADKASIFGPLIRQMEARLRLASATDLSRLAWLHLHAGDQERALEIAQLGLTCDRGSDYRGSDYCQALVDRLSKPVWL